MEKQELVDAAIRHADAVLALKRHRRRHQELLQHATSYRNEQLLPAERHAAQARAQLDAVMGVNDETLQVPA